MLMLYSIEGQGAMFAAADEFSHLLHDDMTSSAADVIGSGAVCRHDNAGSLIPFMLLLPLYRRLSVCLWRCALWRLGSV